MNKNSSFNLLLVLAFLSSACGSKTDVTPIAEPVAATEPARITGTFTYSNSIITDYYSEHAVALVDMHGFVTRDKEWEIPVDSQTLGFLNIDKDKQEGSYVLNLPEIPTGLSEDVDNNAKTDTGVQIYVVAYWPNLVGGAFSEGDDPSRGWPNYLASVKTDTENKDEVIAGSLIVWAADDQQQFPSGFGADGLLFTADDPMGSLASGYSVVNLDTDPFTIDRDAEQSLTLYEPKDISIKDFSGDTYTQAFDKMTDILRVEYAFNDIPDKAPNWDALIDEIRPRVQSAEDNNSAHDWYLALRDFTATFKDGHVGLSAGEYTDADFSRETKGGYGLSLRELDDGRVIAVFVLDKGPAAEAGIKLGAEVTAFNGTPISDAIAATPLSFLTLSTDFTRRYQQLRYMLRAHVGDTANLTFVNPGTSSRTVELTAIAETDSFDRLSIYYGVDTAPMLPVEFKILDSGVGYVSINSNYDDLGLIIKLFERALQTFQAYDVPGIIIDMRYNSGGANLGLAGFLTDQEIPMGQLEYYSETTGKFEPEGPRDVVRPNVEQYRFDKVVLLVGQGCFSACELEAYGFSQIPGAIVVGQTPTAGVEAEVARGQFIMPEGFTLQFPTGRFTLPDGSLFLEGQGVQPTVKVPIDETTVFSEDDVVLQTAEDLIVGK